jgi:hypothetical protein
MHYRRLWALAAFGISSVINPGYFAGCAASEDDNAPDYNAITAGVAELVLNANSSYDLRIDEVAYRLDVDVEPVRAAQAQLEGGSAFAQSARACGTHKLVATAQACLDTYEMDVTGHVTLLRALDADRYEEAASNVAVTGAIEALSMNYGTLALKFEGGRVTLEPVNVVDRSFRLGAHDLQALVAR